MSFSEDLCLLLRPITRGSAMVQTVMPSMALALSLILCAGTPSFAEPPPVLQVSKVLPPELFVGAHHTVMKVVRNDGRFNHYQLKTDYGTYAVRGTDLLRLRVHEINMLAKMNEEKLPGAYLKAAGGSALAPARGALGFIKKPAETTRNAAGAVGKVFGKIRGAFSGESSGHRPDGFVSRLSGYSAAKRKVAAQYGVDPYTRFEPLNDRMVTLARARTSGKLTTRVGFSFVAGPASYAISAGKSLDKLTKDIRDKSVRQLNRDNRAALAIMNVEPSAIDAFLDNASLSPTDKTIIVKSLASLNGAQNRGQFIAYAAKTDTESLAFTVRRQASMLSAYHERVQPVVSVLQLGQTPAIQTGNGHVVVLLRADRLVWTQETALAIKAITAARNNMKPRPKAEFVVTGIVSRQTAAQLKKRGWRLRQNAEF